MTAESRPALTPAVTDRRYKLGSLKRAPAIITSYQLPATLYFFFAPTIDSL
jgi:hypothetical protein